MKRILLSHSLFLVFLATNCQHQKSDEMNIIFNEKTTIEGVYKKCFLSRKDANHQGFYKIITKDSIEIVLLPPYKPDAKRSIEEVSKYEGKIVLVTGVIVHKTYLSKPEIGKAPQSLNTPCFSSIEKIVMKEGED